MRVKYEVRLRCHVSWVGAISSALPIRSDRAGRVIGVAPQQIVAQVAQIFIGNVAAGSNRCVGRWPIWRASDRWRLGAPRHILRSSNPCVGVLGRRRGALVVGGLRKGIEIIIFGRKKFAVK